MNKPSAKPKKPEFPGDTPTGRTRRFLVTVSTTVEIAIDEAIIAQGILPDNPIFGPNVCEEDVVQHLAFNTVVNNLRLSQIEGFANCNDNSIVCSRVYWDADIDREVSPVPPAARSPRRKK